MQPTYEELQAENKALKALVEGKKEPPDDWHAMMNLALRIALHGLPVDLRQELKIGAMAPRADFLIKIDDPGVDLRLKIFSRFLKMNVVEYKGPGDDLGEEELWQAVIYLAAQARESLSKKEATSDDFTITLFRKAKPVKLLRQLGDKAVADEVKGVYHITGWKVNVPTTIVVTGELEGTEYAAFRAISEHPALEDVRLLTEEREKAEDKVLRDAFDALMKLLDKADHEVFEELRRRYPEMAKTIIDWFEPEIREREIRASYETAINYVGHEDAIRDVAKKYGVTVEAVKTILEKNEPVAS